MNDLLPPNATAQERALSLATARASEVDVKLPDLWNPQTCPLDLLPWLAWTLSVETWNSLWPPEIKRAVITSAVDVARHKGTKQSVSDALSALGVVSVLVEWFQKSPPGIPHTFEINLVSADSSLAMQSAMAAEINRTKPLRSHYAINYGEVLTGGLNFAGLFRPGVFVRMDASAYAAPGEIPPPGAPADVLTLGGEVLTLGGEALSLTES